MITTTKKGLNEDQASSENWPYNKSDNKIKDQENRDRLEKLRKEVVASAMDVRRAFLIFGAFSIYLIITVGSTTHVQLLSGTVFRLPLLLVDIPILGFFLFLPALYALAHFNLLGELNSLSDDVKRLRHHLDDSNLKLEASIPFGPGRTLIQPADAAMPQGLINVMTFVAVVIMPPLILLLIQIQFLPYHADWVSWWHRGVITLDIILACFLWSTLRSTGPKRDAAASGSPLTSLARRLDLRKGMRVDSGFSARQTLHSWLLLPVFAFLLFVAFFVATVPDSLMERFAIRTLGWLGTTTINDDQPLEHQDGVIAGSSRENLPPSTYHGTTPARRDMLTLTYIWFESPNSWHWMRRNLVVSHADLVRNRPAEQLLFYMDDEDRQAIWEQGARGLDLRGRDLRYADLSHSDLHRADLRGANLEGAVLFKTKLPYADLGDIDSAKLAACASRHPHHTISKNISGRRADYCLTNLRHAKLQNTDLRHARLWATDLMGANLQWVRLDQADLSYANLLDADLVGATMSFQATCQAMWRGARLKKYHPADYKFKNNMKKDCMLLFRR